MAKPAIFLKTTAVAVGFDDTKLTRRAWFMIDAWGVTSARTLVDFYGNKVVEIDEYMRPVDSDSGYGPLAATVLEAIRTRRGTFKIRDARTHDQVFVACTDGRRLSDFKTAEKAHAAITYMCPGNGADLWRYQVVDVDSGIVNWTFLDGDDLSVSYGAGWDIEAPVAAAPRSEPVHPEAAELVDGAGFDDADYVWLTGSCRSEHVA